MPFYYCPTAAYERCSNKKAKTAIVHRRQIVSAYNFVYWRQSVHNNWRHLGIGTNQLAPLVLCTYLLNIHFFKFSGTTCICVCLDSSVYLALRVNRRFTRRARHACESRHTRMQGNINHYNTEINTTFYYQIAYDFLHCTVRPMNRVNYSLGQKAVEP